MDVPEHLWRFPTREAIDSLAKRFGLRNVPGMQDWEWQVADPARLDEFLGAYLSGGLSDDERFTLMETLLQCFEQTHQDLDSDERWSRVMAALDAGIELHASTVWYWSCVDDEEPSGGFRITPLIRSVFERHRRLLTGSGGSAQT